jgi:hypothetical protein
VRILALGRSRYGRSWMTPQAGERAFCAGKVAIESGLMLVSEIVLLADNQRGIDSVTPLDGTIHF